MRSILPTLFILAPAILTAGDETNAPRKKLSAVSLLPNGSQLHDVLFPRYDENQRLVGVLKAKAMTLVNDETIAGNVVSIEFFNPDGSPRGRADLISAIFNQVKGTLKANESITLQTDRICAKGTGLVYAFEQGEGFLLGPATTWTQAPSATTTMNATPSMLRTTAIVGVSLVSLPLNATPPPAVSGSELAAIQADAASNAPIASQTAAIARKNLAKDTHDAAAAADAARKFLVQADIHSPQTGTTTPESKPLDVNPGPDDTMVECDGGMYFDADEGLFVYLKNVRVTDPRFNLVGADQLKIFLGKKPAEAPGKSDKKKTPDMGLGAKFGDVERIVATGAVRITQKGAEKGKDPVEASGAIFTYHPKSGEIILSGGYPWVKQGKNYMRAKEPNLTLRILKTGSFVTEGNWNMGGNLNQK